MCSHKQPTMKKLSILLVWPFLSLLTTTVEDAPLGSSRAGGYSFDAGVDFLTKASASWREERKCVSCHTNGWALAAQPQIAPKSDEVGLGRQFAQDYLTGFLGGEVKPKGRHGSVEGMVGTAAFLALSDARTGSSVHEVTRRGLDHAWDLLDKSGTWDGWLQCNWPPFESDAEYGPTLMLVALGELRDKAQISSADRRGVRQLIKYLKRNDPVGLHSKAMLIWAAHYWPKVVSRKSRQAWRKELLSARQEDGGWSMASLAGPSWKRDGGGAQVKVSEAYPTAFCIYVLLETGMDPADEVAVAGLRWLRENQRDDGSWYTRSPRRDRKHYISRAATAFSLMALAKRD